MAKVDGVSDEADKVDEVSKVTEVDKADKADETGKADNVDEVDGTDSDSEDAVDAEAAEAEQVAEEDEDDDEADDEASVARSPETEAFWSEVRVEPVEIALPRGVGFTLRAYRPSNEITLSEVDRDEDDFTLLGRPAADVEFDDEDLDDEYEDADEADEDAKDRDKDEADDEDAKDRDEDDEDDDDEDLDEEEVEAQLEAIGSGKVKAKAKDDEDDEDDDDAADESEEIPVFLGKGGKLYLFRTPESLVEFVRSETDHDLAQLDTWQQIRERISVEDVIADEADRYELDLIVDNLRGTKEVWEAELLIKAGEVARDLGYALRIRQVLSALSPGSPLDDLDELLRTSTSGGLGGFFARRKLRKIGAQQASLGWRTIIGKISAAVDWRE